MSLENVRAFYERLASDDAFRVLLQSFDTQDAGREILQNAGFNFTKEEFEEYTAQLLDSENELQDIDAAELASVVGGLVGFYPRLYLIYGAPSPLWDHTNLF
ncbi:MULTISPECIES: Nif11-like leader peptide family natural product precursor [Calothrix]|uniref:Nif11-like leader peptide family natural product n=2 Tax=Calothrix TaxID=1186 RepID=A0ABR8AFV6_9CYAN|nr:MULTISPECIES: Nif11-like leader peptide family natural product precursor [Calothrix]MBD2198634.1 Nif11-like leader peptide family natural product precursor [Calothrix parietina FACHB-288]MBD2227037.1 Nif11-like leader peptide family natural product precursor [Calothrix anomala FACHB-343]